MNQNPHAEQGTSPPTTNPMLEAALAYAARGWAVFPLAPGTKTPFKESHGLKDATTDAEQIIAWWTSCPDANIGAVTGKVSGISVLDWDEKPWEDKYGETVTLRALVERYGTLPKTPVQQTWSGGGQAIFAYTSAGSNAAGGYGQWLDGRNNGGYIVVPPSAVAEGEREGIYAWMPGQGAFDCDLAPMPAWLLEQIKTAEVAKQTTAKTKARKPQSVRELADAGRNSALASLAGTLRRRDVGEETVRQALLAENASFARPLEVDEVEKIIASATRNFVAAEVKDLDARYTDKANAERLAEASGDRIRYCDDMNQWFRFDGMRWVRTSRFGIAPIVTDLAKALYLRAASETDDEKRKRLSAEGQKLESARAVRNVVEMAQSLPELRITPQEFDTDDHLLNLENGTLDLLTEKLLAHDPAHRITKLAPVAYDPEARSALWEDTLGLVTCGDGTLLDFLWRALGYSLTGFANESSFFVFYGPGGSNGKTTVLESMASVLGDYATTLRVESLFAGQDDKIPHDLADLIGARFVVTSELPKGKRYDEAKLKLLTGGDEVTACHKYGNNFRYYPQFKLFMTTNFAPAFSAGDDALWNRAKTVPFRFSFKTYARADKTAKDRLKEPEERAGILTWAVKGCRSWQANGLELPKVVEAETTRHRRDVDVIQAFVDERCVADAVEETVAVSTQELYRTYKAWSKEQPLPQPMSATEFSGEMLRAGYVTVPALINRNRSLRWQGLRLRGGHE